MGLVTQKNVRRPLRSERSSESVKHSIEQSLVGTQAFRSTIIELNIFEYTDLSFNIAGHPEIRCCGRVRHRVRDEEGASVDGADRAAVYLHPPVPPQCARGQGARREARPGDAPQRGL